MINVGIIGATGYAGSELVRIISAHPDAQIKTLTSQSYAGKKYSEVYENYRHKDYICDEEDIEKMADECDVIFLALPHGVASKKVNENILSKTKIIDLGADFRLQNIETYENWYTTHYAKDILPEAIYGLCEINREKIKGKRIVANPGCYTSCSILSLYPLVKEKMIDLKTIIIDAKSGATGAGRGLSLANHYCELNESVKAYKVASHRHTPEIEEQLSYAAGEDVVLNFTPHLIPMDRGILATCYANLNKDYTYDDIRSAYEKYYKDEYFIRLTKEGTFPETKWVKGSNFVDIGFTIDKRTNRVIVIGALDNLFKGAAGQAVQNMNILFGLDEKTGIDFVPVFPA
ncbi:MAG TPA: N-acetyl-gamma-glutamyl-phosphate reductase [Lachnospiraceae bacterium]|nr:N-acetyl-gamma-glutamyl-phosphate reductase [Lachnospiraceae bacterium]